MEYTYFLKLIATVLFGVILGFLSSIPVGGVQIEVIKKTINGHKKPAIATALGSATSDLIYGLLALFGFGNYLLNKDFQLLIYSLGIVVLSYIMFKSFKDRSYAFDENKQIRYKKRFSFLTGFSIAITNPGMIIWWFVGFKLFVDLNMFTEITNAIKIIFVLSGVFGLALYLTLVAVILHRYQKSLSERFIYRANIFLFVILSILILYFIVKLLSLIFNFNLHI
jgi:threonine/homoserine/homoserine lactone efflux protein